MSISLHKVALESGAELAPAYEIDGSMQPATYTVTLEQLEAIVGTTAGRLLTALDVEISRLTDALKKANDQAESFERRWYLRGTMLEKIQARVEAYPLAIFPEPDLQRAHELLTAGGMMLDSISASSMRHVLDGLRGLLREGLAE